jgi:hypothetical protein
MQGVAHFSLRQVRRLGPRREPGADYDLGLAQQRPQLAHHRRFDLSGRHTRDNPVVAGHIALQYALSHVVAVQPPPRRRQCVGDSARPSTPKTSPFSSDGVRARF